MLINLRYGLRASRVLWTATPVILSLLRDWRRYFLWRNPRILSETAHQRRAIKIRDKLESLGIVFIKVGQVLSTRGDLLPTIYLNELSKLQDSVQPLPAMLVQQTLEREYHRQLSEVFDEFEIKPLATASIGQVHRALHNGREVVVKFARPNILAQLERDCRTALLLLYVAENLFRLLKITELDVFIRFYRIVISEIFQGMREETDLGHERQNAELMARTVADMSELIIPKTVPELCTDHVLVLEYWSGTKVSHFHELEQQGHSIRQIMQRLVTIYVRMIVSKGVYHADPHPGNIYIRPDGRIIIFDFGVVRTLSDETRRNLVQLGLAAVRKDIDGVIECLYKLGILLPSADRAIARSTAEKFAALHFKGLASKERFTEAAEAIYEEFKGFPLNLPQELVYVMRCLSLLEGLGSRYQPGWNLINEGYPAIRAAFAEYLVKSEGGWWNVMVSFIKGFIDFFKSN
ncbi:MAG: AarF/UbiB family protein [Acidobacteriota bacterium]